MEYIKDGKNYILRLEVGDEFNSSLEKFMVDENIPCAFIKGLGAVKDAELGYYDLEDRDYIRQTFSEDAELLSAIGNLSFKEGKAYAHVHVVLSGKDFKCYGGHLFKATVSVTAEVFVETFAHKIDREYNDQVGLQLMSCKI